MVAGTNSSVFINEFHYDDTDGDEGEFVEIANPTGMDLTGWTVVLYNGSSSSLAPYNTLNLSGTDLFQSISLPTNGLQNGSPDGIALVDGGGSVVQFLSYEGTFTAASGPAAGLTSTDVGVEESNSTTLAGQSLQLAGTDGSVAGDFTWQAPADDTPGAANNGQSFAAPAPSIVINELQVSTTGSDFEFVELFGDAGLDLSTYTLLEIEGDSNKGRINSVNSFSGTIDSDGFYVRLNALGETTYSVTSDGTQTSEDFQNGTGTYLLVTGFTGADEDDLDTNDDGVFDVTPWDAIVDAVALNDGDAGDVTYATPVLSPDGSFLPSGVYRSPDGGDFSAQFLNFSTPDGTPGAANPAPTPTPTPTASVTINEFRVAQSGDDADFVELIGDANTALTGLTLLAVSGEFAPGQIDFAFDLSAGSTDADGFFLLADDDLPGTPDSGDIVTNFDFFGSPQTLLVVSNFTGTTGTDLDTNDDGTFDATPWDSILSSISIIDGDMTADVNYSAEVFSDPAGFTPAGGRRNPDETGDFELLGFTSQDLDTPGSTNTPVVPATPATIMEIQGAAHTSPLLDQSVVTTGIVTAIDSNAFYLQDPTGDGDIATSDAILVFTGSAPAVAIGDAVEVTGTVSEFFPGGQGTNNLSTTQISATNVAVTSSGNPLPAAVILGDDRTPPSELIDDDGLTSFDPETDGIDFFESLESMLVTVNDPLAVSGTNQFGELFTVANNGADATNLSDRGTLNVDGNGGNLGTTETGPGNDFNPEKIQIDTDSTVSPGDVPEVATGTLLNDVTGVIGYDFGNFQVIPTEEITIAQASTLTPETTALTGDEDTLTIASYNVLNLDPNDMELASSSRDRDTDVADGQFTEIAAQIVNALNAPDIIALQEVQDNNGSDGAASNGSPEDGVVSASETLQLLVDEIAAAGGPTYSWIDNPFITDDASGGQPGGNIRTAFLYNPDRVTLVDGSVTSIQFEDQATNPENPFFDARLPLVATFDFEGEEYTVVNNHFSSKGGSDPILGVVQPPVNGSFDERFDQATAVANFVTPLIEAGDNVVVLGDLNEFEFEDPLDPLEDASLINLTNRLPEEERYSFNFQGNSQSLDHIFVSPNLDPVADFDIVHTNSEFAASAVPSDHDPLVVALGIPDKPPVAANDFDETTEDVAVTVDVLGNDDDEDGENDALALSNIVGGTGSVAINDNGTLTYTPEMGFTGTDSFSYTITDTQGLTDTATVFISVLPGLDDDSQAIDGDATDNVIAAGDGNDSIDGGEGSDFLGGLDGDDVIRGSDGDDRLTGGRDNDILIGGLGADVLYGGFGDDTFRFADGDLSSDISNTDQITDFGLFGDDILDLSQIDANTNTAEDDDFTFIGDAAFSGTAGELRFEVGDSFTDVYGDTDGDGEADIAIRLYNHADIELDRSAIIG